ncbi:hypothetical protein [Iningainema tapete]|uniref:Transposase n=1 Tax=Iningainema tapete BLCC-T55 TaxID=2748662 RepID=A0A8J6XGJ0_9CYAN|nr:hypothetical protein [Iningainema tapete]MBD2772092.1 hypothetical protein [Iningainema tapete BLCC-T55]
MKNIQVIKQAQQAPKKSLPSSERCKQDCYCLKAYLEIIESVVEVEMRGAGRFVLATNVLDEAFLSNDEMYLSYKAQQSCERGFGFLKDPLFFTDSVFLKSLLLNRSIGNGDGVMFISLHAGAKTVLSALSGSNSGIKNRRGKWTDRPTLRLIFQGFQSIHLLVVNHVKQISNLTDERLWILRLFPATCRKYYLFD